MIMKKDIIYNIIEKRYQRQHRCFTALQRWNACKNKSLTQLLPYHSCLRGIGYQSHNRFGCKNKHPWSVINFSWQLPSMYRLGADTNNSLDIKLNLHSRFIENINKIYDVNKKHYVNKFLERN